MPTSNDCYSNVLQMKERKNQKENGANHAASIKFSSIHQQTASTSVGVFFITAFSSISIFCLANVYYSCRQSILIATANLPKNGRYILNAQFLLSLSFSFSFTLPNTHTHTLLSEKIINFGRK